MKCEGWINQDVTIVGQTKNLSPRQESNPWPLFFRRWGRLIAPYHSYHIGRLWLVHFDSLLFRLEAVSSAVRCCTVLSCSVFFAWRRLAVSSRNVAISILSDYMRQTFSATGIYFLVHNGLLAVLRMHLVLIHFMYQSIPAVPTLPGNRGAFSHVVSPRGGTFAILSRPGGWAFAYLGATPGHLTHVFLKVPWMSSAEKTRRLWSNGLSIRD